MIATIFADEQDLIALFVREVVDGAVGVAGVVVALGGDGGQLDGALTSVLDEAYGDVALGGGAFAVAKGAQGAVFENAIEGRIILRRGEKCVEVFDGQIGCFIGGRIGVGNDVQHLKVLG